MTECAWNDCARDPDTHAGLPFSAAALCEEHARVVDTRWKGVVSDVGTLKGGSVVETPDGVARLTLTGSADSAALLVPEEMVEPLRGQVNEVARVYEDDDGGAVMLDGPYDPL